jgi:hypothetical protein
MSIATLLNKPGAGLVAGAGIVAAGTAIGYALGAKGALGPESGNNWWDQEGIPRWDSPQADDTRFREHFTRAATRHTLLNGGIAAWMGTGLAAAGVVAGAGALTRTGKVNGAILAASVGASILGMHVAGRVSERFHDPTISWNWQHDPNGYVPHYMLFPEGHGQLDPRFADGVPRE